MTRLSLSRPGMSVGILKAEVADLKFQNFHSKELERCLAFDALALLGGNEYLVQVEYFCTTQQFEEQKTFEKVQNGNEYLVQVDPHCFCTTQQFDEQETFEKMQNGNEYLFQVYPHLFVLSNFDCKHYVQFKTLPKAQRTRGLSSSCQSNFLRSYHKFKHKS